MSNMTNQPTLLTIFSQSGVCFHDTPQDDTQISEGNLTIFEKFIKSSSTKSIFIEWKHLKENVQNTNQNEKTSTISSINSNNSDNISSRNRNESSNSFKNAGWTYVDDEQKSDSTFQIEDKSDDDNFIVENFNSQIKVNEYDEYEHRNSNITIVNKNSRRKKSNFCIDINQLQQIKTSPRNFTWQYLTFILLNKKSIPPLHFHNGGSSAFLEILQNYCIISPNKTNETILNIVTKSNNEALVRSLDELNIFGEHDDKPDSKFDKIQRKFQDQRIQNFLKDPVKGTLQGLSKFGGLISGALDSHPGHRPNIGDESFHFGFNAFDQFSPEETSSNFEIPEQTSTGMSTPIKEDYELLSAPKNEIDKIFKKLKNFQNKRYPITLLNFESQYSSNGSIINFENLKLAIYNGGIADDETRREIYPYILNIRDPTDKHEQFLLKRKVLISKYKTLKTQWMTISQEQENRFSDFASKKCLINKDLIRTDRTIEEFQVLDSPSMVKLKNVLMTYLMYNFDLGYCQGMSDIASVLVQSLDDEVDAFWCFDGFMKIIGSNFEIDQVGIKNQLAQLRSLIEFLDPDLCKFLQEKESLNMYFCFRWILIWFKREFKFEELKQLWDVLLTGLPCKNFQLVIAVSILINYKPEILEKDLSFTDILRFINDQSEKINLNEILYISDELFKMLKNLNDNSQLPKRVALVLF